MHFVSYVLRNTNFMFKIKLYKLKHPKPKKLHTAMLFAVQCDSLHAGNESGSLLGKSEIRWRHWIKSIESAPPIYLRAHHTRVTIWIFELSEHDGKVMCQWVTRPSLKGKRDIYAVLSPGHWRWASIICTFFLCFKGHLMLVTPVRLRNLNEVRVTHPVHTIEGLKHSLSLCWR